jgi:membrane-associated phospholipid phosphatase
MKRPQQESPKNNLWIQDVFFITLFGCLWKLYFIFRPQLIDRVCLSHPEKCDKKTLLAIDQVSVGKWDQNLDFASFFTQDLIAVIVVYLILTNSLYTTKSRSQLFLTALKLTVVNGFFTETLRSFVQRPRPWLYEAPPIHADAFGHYNSFVSGHASFATAMGLWGISLVSESGMHKYYKILINASLSILILSTGILRVLAGRHFVTDIIGGMSVGVLSFLLIHKSYLERVFSFRRAP